MLVIDNAQVSQLLTMADRIRAQEEAFAELPTGGAVHRPRVDLYSPGPDEGYVRWGRWRAPTTASSPSG